MSLERPHVLVYGEAKLTCEFLRTPLAEGVSCLINLTYPSLKIAHWIPRMYGERRSAYRPYKEGLVTLGVCPAASVFRRTHSSGVRSISIRSFGTSRAWRASRSSNDPVIHLSQSFSNKNTGMPLKHPTGRG